MKLTVVGCGDAFGSGGRLQTCYHFDSDASQFLVDCGATALIGFQRCGLDPDKVETILISHLHGDHFSGLVWWMLYANHVSRRTAPLTVAGPPGIERRFKTATEALFPGSAEVALRFQVTFVEYAIGRPQEIGPVRVLPLEVNHPSGAPSCALRIADGRHTIAFSGDTEWVDSLVTCARGADLFLVECYGFDTRIPYHLSWKELAAKFDMIGARRYLLTHMGAKMLANRGAVGDPRVVMAEDGLVLEI